ncbi:hypothetical protein FEM48_Zijuj02G0030600 [Ziziphus jujuba var. spinosa]|uniref:Demeter RRM-fold domain-containing protein n=1 Tax=Ziziphus jujuba var. spinosa TaxID=714518 RepID=A0A978VT89_ZIZJJ|nr:hypothetical protein FEM48_Zijuj02G0030600 [Ziziphus jujuba var. spinosa]
MASEPILYGSNIGTSMEEEEEQVVVKKQCPLGPHTPAKQIPNRTQKTYSRNPGKKNTLPSNTSSSSSAFDVSTITGSPEKSNDGKESFLPDLNIACREEPPNNFSQETNINLGSEKITETIAADACVGDLGIATEEEGNRLLPSVNYNGEKNFHAANPFSAIGSASSVASKKSQNNLKKRPNNDLDLDKKPRKKPKKKIHRPKVVGEGKPKRTLAPKTPTKRAPKLKKPKAAPKSEKLKRAAKKHLSSGKRENMKNLENSETITEEVFMELSVSDPVGSLAVSLSVPNHLTDESTSAVVTSLQTHNNGCEMPGNSIPFCERIDLCQAIEGLVRDCSTNQSEEDHQNHYGENDYLSFPKKLRKLRSKRRRRSEWKVIIIEVNKASKKSMAGRRNYVTRLSRRIETALLDKIQSVSHPKKKRTTRCRARHNLAISNASTILSQLPIAPHGEVLANGRHQIEVSQMDEANKEVYQLPIAPFGDTLANGRHEIEVSQMDEPNEKALFAEERVTEMQLEEHKKLQHAARGDSEERSMEGSTEFIPSHLYTEFHIGLIKESPSQEEDFVFTGKSIGDYKMKGSKEMGSPPVLEFNPSEHDKAYLTDNSIDMNDKNEGGLLDLFPSEYGAPVHYQILQDQSVDIFQASQRNGQFAAVKKKPRKKNANISQASDGAIVPHNGQSAVVEQKRKNKLKYDPRFQQMWKFQLKYLTNESEERKKYWESERKIFKGRIDAFTARMHQILGDRRFSPWKGSVLDSVIGVFLTQNVSDSLSSNAFMLLAAKFPARPRSQDPIIDFSQESVGSNTEYLEPAYTSEESETAGVTNLADEDMPTCLAEDCSIEAKDDIYLQNNSKKALAVSELNANSMIQERQNGESSNSKEQQPDKTNKRNGKKVYEKEKVKTDWDAFRKMYCTTEQRRPEHMDSVDWEAVRNAEAQVIAKVIEARGQNNVLAGRIKRFLDQVVELHNCLDLEWLRHAPPDKVKEYLLQFQGLGLKSVECVRLLELQNVAFPVDTNVGRIAVRLGWVPLQPMPEKVQIHLLQHARGALPGPTNTSKASSKAPIVALGHPGPSLDPTLPFLLEANWFSASQHQKQNVETIIEVQPSPEPAASQHQKQNAEPIIEVPPSPEPASCESEFPHLGDIEDFGLDGPDDMPTINLSTQESTGTMNSLSVMLHDDYVLSRDLVPLSAEAASKHVSELKHASRLRTKHEVYELPDYHPLLNGFERRDAHDPYPYLLAIRAPGESSTSSQPSQTPGEPCSSSCTEQNHHTVDGSILIPCRTAMRGSFPLNGTYFQVNEVFLDQKTSSEPIKVPRGWIWNLPRRTAYFGTSAGSILRGLSTEEIQHCFWAGFICVRSFDREGRHPVPLAKEFHIPTSQQSGKAKINEDDDE